jgi:hypothetical protein
MKKMIAFSLVLALVVILLPLRTAIGDDGEYGIVATNNGVEMYKDVHGNLHSIVIGPNGEKEVVLSRYEEAPLEALIKRDAKESKGKSALPEDILRKFYLFGGFSAASSYYSVLPSIVSYNQRYRYWGSETLGFGPDTIAESGCFLTSCAMMLATYGIELYRYEATPLSLNTWLKNFQYNPQSPYESGGFYHDLLKFGAIAHIPGIRDIGYFDSFSDAQIAIYYHIIPILEMVPEHYSPLVKTNGGMDLNENWIMNTHSYNYTYDYNTNLGRVYSPYTGVVYFGTVAYWNRSFASSDVFRTAYPEYNY